MQKRAAPMIKIVLCSLFFFTAAAACDPGGDPIATTESAMSFQTMTATAAPAPAPAPADECVLAAGRRVPRTLYQIGACAWAAGVIASGYGAITACCPAGEAGTSTTGGAVSQNCQSARTWVPLSHEYWGARCLRSMSCGEINGLLLWFSTKKTLFANLQRWCGEDGVEEISDYVYEDATELGD